MAVTFGLAVALACSQPTLGQDEKRIVVPGIGARSCGLWMEVRANRQSLRSQEWIAAREWIAGYLSAYNAHVSPTGNAAGKTDQEGMYGWLDRYCQGHPTDALLTALEQFIRAP